MPTLIDHLRRIASALQVEDRDDWEYVYRAAARLEAVESIFPGFNAGVDKSHARPESEVITQPTDRSGLVKEQR